jgi:hypothetical protein
MDRPPQIDRLTPAGRWAQASSWALTAVRLGLFLAAVCGILRLAAAEIEFRDDTPATVLRAASIGNSEYRERLAELQPEQAREVLRQAALADPRAASVWISLGLLEERLGERRLAETRGLKKRGLEKPSFEKRGLEGRGAAEPGAEKRGGEKRNVEKHDVEKYDVEKHDVEKRDVEQIAVPDAVAGASSGDFGLAREAFETAVRVDHQYAPAWALANFCFRQADPECFWRAAVRAAARAPALADPAQVNLTDLRPLLDLAGRMEPAPLAVLDRLSLPERNPREGTRADTLAEGVTAWRAAHMEKAYLDDLIGQNRWEDAVMVARRVASHRDAANTARLDDFVTRLLVAGRAGAAIDLWNRYAGFAVLDPARGLSLTNGDFASAPREAGFDWRLGLPASETVSASGRQPSGGIEPRWTPALVEFRFPGGELEQTELAEQWLPLRAGTFRLRFEYLTRDLPSPTGIRWEFAGREATAAARAEARAEAPPFEPSERWREAQWKFSAASQGVAPLRLIYRREPGTERARGTLLLRRVRLEVL